MSSDDLSVYCRIVLKILANLLASIDLPAHRIEPGQGGQKIEQMYKNIHPNLALVLFFERTEVGSCIPKYENAFYMRHVTIRL